MFKDELTFFIANQDKLVAEHQGKVLAIKGDKILGVYDTPLQAYLETRREHALGTFMIQACVPGPQAYSVTIGSLRSFD